MSQIKLLIIFVSMITVNARYPLYYSDDQNVSNSSYDCLYAYMIDSFSVADGSYMVSQHLIPYCRRPDQSEEEEEENSLMRSYKNVHNQNTFSDLYKQGITSSQLLDWSATIETAERYETNGPNSNEIFYNCSYPWFGSTCQYRLTSNALPSFGRLVQHTLANRDSPPIDVSFVIGTCYGFLSECNRGPSPMCLDWREICDGNYDCVNREDEEFCQPLEAYRCGSDEFRCYYSGECIPQAFVRDGIYSIDCLDCTDEMTGLIEDTAEKKYCHAFPTFQCEESTSPERNVFSCGDGQYHYFLIPHFDRLCSSLRDRQMTIAMITSLDYISDLDCRQALHCLLRIDDLSFDVGMRDKKDCQFFLDRCPSQWLVFPQYPTIHTIFQFFYHKKRSVSNSAHDLLPDFLCFNPTRCPGLLKCSSGIEMYEGLNCCPGSLITTNKLYSWRQLVDTLEYLFRRCSMVARDKTCTNPSLYYCQRSLKCISKHRLLDGHPDCYFGEDESLSIHPFNHSQGFISGSQTNEYISTLAFNKRELNPSDENFMYRSTSPETPLPFGRFCDESLDSPWSNETDETNCEWWPCTNPYVQCDGYFNCFNGLDELNCPYSSCASNELLCSDDGSFKNVLCFPQTHLMEDHTTYHPKKTYRDIYLSNETVSNISNFLLWNQTKCITLEHLSHGYSASSSANEDVCLMPNYEVRIVPKVPFFTKNKNRICAFFVRVSRRRNQRSFFQTSRLNYFPSVSSLPSMQSAVQSHKNKPVNPEIDYGMSWYCNRGIQVLYQNNETTKCICPPSYFGDRCQWQNQRVSLTIQFVYRSLTYVMPVFQVIVMLIDEQGQISSYHEQMTYVPKRDCGIKFNIYLLYPHRPRNSSANYSIRVDIFDRVSVRYWASWHLSIPFPFLPVSRIATRLFIPMNMQQSESSCPFSCGHHGRCIRYINSNSLYFCQCNTGYSGLRCDVRENCSCSFDSFCLRSSICICPTNKFGRKCYLKHLVCQLPNNSCENNGECIPIDDRIALNDFTCLCRDGFHGKRCENKTENQIDVAFNEKTIATGLPVFIHFITAIENANHVQRTKLQKIKYGQNTITLFATYSFHLVFIELFNGDYYLVVSREHFITSEYIQSRVLSDHRCVYIDKLLNETLRSYSNFHRIKFYPLLCRQNKSLACFYDDNYMCVCDEDRFSNCFTFNHTKAHDCEGENPCANDGKCFQDNSTCASVLTCICPDCFYGQRCQLSTQGFGLSLDYILGYHIKPNLSFSRQPSIVKVSVAITTLIFIMGLISGFLCIITFRRKHLRTVGCGLYLLVSGWISVLIVFVLLIKFCQLLLSQMAIYTNRSLLTVECIVLDMILRVLLASNDWLDGCVSLERVITVKNGLAFNKMKSRRIAKWMTLSVIIFTILTHLHDPLHRQLIDDLDVDEERIWCIVEYSSSINIFNSFITLFHFLVPFTINVLSTIAIVVLVARNRSTIQPHLTYIEHVKLQLKQHRHHFIASFILVILALPRLIISFVSGCMKPPHNSWLFLVGYFISFLPSMMTFIVYVLPSKAYKDEFDSVIQQAIRRFRNVFEYL